MSPLRLRENVFMARADGVLIFLDLAGDRYFALNSELSARLQSAIEANGEGADEDIVRRLRDWLSEPAAILQVVQHSGCDAVTQKRLIERAGQLAAGDHALGVQGLHTYLRSCIVRAQVHADRIDIALDQERICRGLDGAAEQTEPIDNAQSQTDRQVAEGAEHLLAEKPFRR